MYWAQESPADRHQLLQPTRAASRVHQRCEEHVCVPGGELRLQAGGHGDPYGRPAEPNEPAYETKYPAGYALAGEGCPAERFSILPLLRYASGSEREKSACSY